MHFESRPNCGFAGVMKKTLIGAGILLNLIIFCPGTAVGQLDPAFAVGGIAATTVPTAPIATFVLPDGKILVVGGYSSVFFARFNSDGTLDLSYGADGALQIVMPYIGEGNGRVTSAVRQDDGKIILAGSDNRHGFITRFNMNGSLDTGFGDNGVARISQGSWSDGFYDIILLPDGKILGVGETTSSNTDIFLARFSGDGTVDTTFAGGAGLVVYTETLTCCGIWEMKVLRQSDGKLLVYRRFAGGDSPTNARIRRFNADGTLDNTHPGILFHGSFCKMELQPDDKIVIAGVVQKADNLERKQNDIAVVRYTTSGTLDSSFGGIGSTSFDITSSFDDEPKALKIAPDGQILISVFTHVPLNRSSVRGYHLALARVAANGSAVTGRFLQTDKLAATDTSNMSGGNAVLTIQPDGKILTTHRWGATSFARLLLIRAIDVPDRKYRFKGTPFDFNYIPVGPSYDLFSHKADAEQTQFRPGSSKWYSYLVSNNYPTFGITGDIPVAADYIGNFGTDLAVFRPGTGTWYIAKTLINPGTNFVAVQWGLSSDVPAPADFDGDGKSDITVFRPSNGVWYIRNSVDTSVRMVQWGLDGDKPVPGDFDGDGLGDVAVWRPSDGIWYILRSSDGQGEFVNFGMNGDVPVHDDFDGDGTTDIGVWRPSTGTWYVRASSDGGFMYFNWGVSTDIAVPADYDGDRKTDFAVWRPSTGQWFMNRSSDSSYTVLAWGLPTDSPVPGRR